MVNLTSSSFCRIKKHRSERSKSWETANWLIRGGVRHWPWPWHPGIYPMVNGQKSWPWPWHPRFCPWSMVKLTNFGHLTTEILEFWPWSWSKIAIFDHLTTAILKFWPWSWSKIFDHLTMTPGRRPNGQKIVVILPPLINFFTMSLLHEGARSAVSK